MSDKNVHHIFKQTHKIAIFVAVFATVLLSVGILVWLGNKTNDVQYAHLVAKKSQPTLKVVDQAQLISEHKKNIKQILAKYLMRRKEVKTNCQQLIGLTVQQVLNLTVPTDFKGFHLKLVVLLDKENSICNKTGKFDENLDSEWKVLLGNYNWLGSD